LDDVVVRLRPVETTAEAPYINEVANDVERFKLPLAQKIEQGVCLRTARSEMYVRYPACAKMLLLHGRHRGRNGTGINSEVIVNNLFYAPETSLVQDRHKCCAEDISHPFVTKEISDNVLEKSHLNRRKMRKQRAHFLRSVVLPGGDANHGEADFFTNTTDKIAALRIVAITERNRESR
jgi:hypothetical protein